MNWYLNNYTRVISFSAPNPSWSRAPKCMFGAVAWLIEEPVEIENTPVSLLCLQSPKDPGTKPNIHRYLPTASHLPSCIHWGYNSKQLLRQPQTRRGSPAPCHETPVSYCKSQKTKNQPNHRVCGSSHPPRKAPTGFLAGSVEPAACLKAGEVEKHRAGMGFAAERSRGSTDVRAIIVKRKGLQIDD